MGALLKLATAFIGIRGRIPQLKKLSWKDIATFGHLIGSLFMDLLVWPDRRLLGYRKKYSYVVVAGPHER